MLIANFCNNKGNILRDRKLGPLHFSLSSLNIAQKSLYKKNILHISTKYHIILSRPHKNLEKYIQKCNNSPIDFETAKIVNGSCFDEIIQNLKNRVITNIRNLPDSKQLLIGIAGPPGSGKTTIAKNLSKELNEEMQDSYISAFIPMDGFHYYKSELDAMDDPVTAHARRGAHWTFNAERFFKALKQLRESQEGCFPSFDHGIGDPIENDIVIKKSTKVVIVEGNYLIINVKPWNEIKGLFDERWYVSCPLEICKERVYKRHLATGKNKETAWKRVVENDGPNAEFIEKYNNNAELIIKSNIPL